ncbi:MAG TPA: spore maturation protein [Firmicutes bacterium]|nr:spore maturation protein [Bacillota bacterium]
MKYVALIIPALFFALFLYALLKKVRLYDCFTEGVKEAVPLLLSIFPYLAAMLMLSELFERSGFSAALTQALSPVFSALGIPPEISKLVLLKPFSGSGSTALLSEIISAYGADSYIARCAAVAYGSSETVFYISAVYFAGSKKNLAKPVVISLTSNFISVILGCLLCKVL